MCLTLPDVPASIVGIEKVVPTWADLDVFLQLLPRSSTGERMNPYTSTWSGVTPGDGPQELHVVLLDNGRSRVLADEVGRQALRCIRCSACLNVCPVYERTGGHADGSVYPGPIGAILNPLLRGPGADAQTDSLPYASSLCGACYDVCPVLIDIPSVLVDLRAQVVDAHRSSGGRLALPKAEAVAMKAAGRALSSGRRIQALERLSSLAGRAIGTRRSRRLPSGRAAITWLPRTGLAVDSGPRPPSSAHRILPGVVGPHSGQSMTARDDILGRVRSALRHAPRPPAVPRDIRAASGDGDLLEMFAERLTEYRAEIVRCAADDVEARIVERLGSVKTVVPADLPWDSAWLRH